MLFACHQHISSKALTKGQTSVSVSQTKRGAIQSWCTRSSHGHSDVNHLLRVCSDSNGDWFGHAEGNRIIIVRNKLH